MNPEPIDSEEIRRFEDQFRRNPDSLVFARLADAHRKAGDPTRALEILEAGITRHGAYPSAHIVRARAYLDLGRSRAAEQSFRKAIELDASNLVAMRGLASLARERGDEASARLWFQRISGLDPASPEPSRPEQLPPTEEAAWTPDEAVADAEDERGEAWWFEDPSDAGKGDDGDLLTRTMAELYEKQGLMNEAAAIYRELLEDRPDDEAMRAALERIETMRPVDKEIEVETEAPRTAEPQGSSGHSEVFLEWLRGLTG